MTCAIELASKISNTTYKTSFLEEPQTSLGGIWNSTQKQSGMLCGKTPWYRKEEPVYEGMNSREKEISHVT